MDKQRFFELFPDLAALPTTVDRLYELTGEGQIVIYPGHSYVILPLATLYHAPTWLGDKGEGDLELRAQDETVFLTRGHFTLQLSTAGLRAVKLSPEEVAEVTRLLLSLPAMPRELFCVRASKHLALDVVLAAPPSSLGLGEPTHTMDLPSCHADCWKAEGLQIVNYR